MHDTGRVRLLGALTLYYNHNDPDSALIFAKDMITLAQKIKYPYGEALSFALSATTMDRIGNWSKSYDMARNCRDLADKLTYGKAQLLAMSYSQMGLIEGLYEKREEGINHLRQALYWASKTGKPENSYFQLYSHIAYIFSRSPLVDSLYYYANKAFQLSLRSDNLIFKPFTLGSMAKANEKLGNPELAKLYYYEAIAVAKQVHHLFQQVGNTSNLASLLLKTGNPDSAIYYANIAYKIAYDHHFAQFYLDAAGIMKKCYEMKNEKDSTLKYLNVMLATKDSVFNQASFSNSNYWPLMKVSAYFRQNWLRKNIAIK
jgi:hypothetical protein